jgi:hypothetical protein
MVHKGCKRFYVGFLQFGRYMKLSNTCLHLCTEMIMLLHEGLIEAGQALCLGGSSDLKLQVNHEDRSTRVLEKMRESQVFLCCTRREKSHEKEKVKDKVQVLSMRCIKGNR